MARLRYTTGARNDLSDIYHYIRNQSGSGETAARFVRELRAKCRALADAPITMGRPRTELRLDLRSHPHGNYVIFFRYVDDELEIVDVLEGHRDIEAFFADEDGV